MISIDKCHSCTKYTTVYIHYLFDIANLLGSIVDLIICSIQSINSFMIGIIGLRTSVIRSMIPCRSGLLQCTCGGDDQISEKGADQVQLGLSHETDVRMGSGEFSALKFTSSLRSQTFFFQTRTDGIHINVKTMRTQNDTYRFIIIKGPKLGSRNI